MVVLVSSSETNLVLFLSKLKSIPYIILLKSPLWCQNIVRIQYFCFKIWLLAGWKSLSNSIYFHHRTLNLFVFKLLLLATQSTTLHLKENSFKSRLLKNYSALTCLSQTPSPPTINWIRIGNTEGVCIYIYSFDFTEEIAENTPVAPQRSFCLNEELKGW